MHKLRLYVTGLTPKSEKIIQNIRQLLEEQFSSDYSLKIVDVFESPELAEHDKILATPTLIKVTPAPVKRIIGDFSNRDMVLAGLDLVR